MEIVSIAEDNLVAKKTASKKINSSSVEKGLESVILDYAISTFPFAGAFESVPGYRKDELHLLIQEMISEGIVKVGFYYEEMQQNLTILYFLRLTEEKHMVLGLDPQKVTVGISNVKGIFRLNDEQYMNLLKIPLS